MANSNWWEYQRGPRVFLWSFGKKNLHSGIDLQAPCGTDIQSPVEGTVLNAHTMPWGGQIDVATDQIPNLGPVILTFLHTSAEYVQAGDKVTPGISLGASGQPPPGAGYGGGCHIHFEVTHGTNAPYDSGKYSPSQNPDQHQFPLDPGQVLDWIITHKPPAPGGGYKGPPSPNKDPCGPLPDPNNYALRAADPQYLGALNDWFACEQSHGRGPGGVGLSNPLDALKPVGAFFDALGPWVTNPARILKMVLGIAFVLLGLVIAFLPDIAAGTAAAVGAPELAGPAAALTGGGHVKRAIGGAIRAGGRAKGREKTITKEEITAQRAYARARTREEIRLTREAQTRPLKANQQAQLVNLQAQRGAETERAARTAPLILQQTARRVPSAQSRVQRGPARGPLVVPSPTAGERATTGRLHMTMPQAAYQGPGYTPSVARGRVGSLKPEPGQLQREAPPRTAQVLNSTAREPKPRMTAEEFNRKYPPTGVAPEVKLQRSPEARKKADVELRKSIADLGLGEQVGSTLITHTPVTRRDYFRFLRRLGAFRRQGKNP